MKAFFFNAYKLKKENVGHHVSMHFCNNEWHEFSFDKYLKHIKIPQITGINELYMFRREKRL